MNLELLRELASWTAGLAQTPYAGVALFAIAFAESSFFPVPPDVLMIPLALGHIPYALFFAAIATAGSVIGGMLGYLIGNKGGRPLLMRFFKPHKIALVERQYQRYDVWAVGLAAFTPIPYKLFSISAGVFCLDFKRFVVASALGRGGRFFLVGLVITIFGEPVRAFLDTSFELAVVGFAVLFIGSFFVLNILARRRGSTAGGPVHASAQIGPACSEE